MKARQAFSLNVSTVCDRFKYRLTRVKKTYALNGLRSAVVAIFWQILADTQEVVLQGWWRLRYPGGLIERHTEVGLILLSYRDKGVSRQLLRGDIREPLLVELLRKELRPGMHGFDIGANIGYYVLVEDKIVGSAGSIVACEPVPETASLLTENVAKYCSSNVSVQRVAVSNHNNTLRMSHTATWNVSRVVETAARDSDTGTISVPAVTLDELRDRVGLERVDFVRMDIEGHEIAATEGMTSILSGSESLKLFIEVHNMLFRDEGAQVSRWLEMLFGYGLKPGALTAGNRIEWIKEPGKFIERVVSQKRSCVHVFLSR